MSALKRRKVEVHCDGSDITYDGGAVLLLEIDQRIGLTQLISGSCLPRRKGAFQHSQLELVRQRIFVPALGYEDLNYHTELRQYGAVQTAVGRLNSLASASTLCRIEQHVGRESAFKLHKILLEQ